MSVEHSEDLYYFKRQMEACCVCDFQGKLAQYKTEIQHKGTYNFTVITANIDDKIQVKSTMMGCGVTCLAESDKNNEDYKSTGKNHLNKINRSCCSIFRVS